MLNDLEMLVLKLILKEHSSNHIAKELRLSIIQVNQIRKDIYNKMEVKTQIGLLKKSIKQGIIKLEDLLHKS